MEKGSTLVAHWAMEIAALSAERGWNLNTTDIARYLFALCQLLPETCALPELRRTCAYYHADHQFVEALHRSSHHLQKDHWMAWMAQISHILHETGLAWSSDHVINNEDVAQVAQMALVTSLPKYAYRSSFSTWAHTVVVQSVCRYLRDTKAKKHG